MGPLKGLRVIEMKGIGPAPFAGMLLADMGAEVIVVERSKTASGLAPPSKLDINARGKKSVVINLKSSEGLEVLKKLTSEADLFIEGYRPGVAERLGFGPDVMMEVNPRLIYGRMTGWGQTGPLASSAGHDLNYIALTGALAAIGSKNKPTVPLNLIGDYAGGSLYLIMGLLAALYDVGKSGSGQVIDAAIVDGSASLMSLFYSLDRLGAWKNERESNFLDGAAHFYNSYKTQDEMFISIGAIEPQFYQQLLSGMDLDTDKLPHQMDSDAWPKMRQLFASIFREKTQAEWCLIFEGSDACFAPILDFKTASSHPHLKARGSFVEVDSVVQPAPAPRFSKTQLDIPSAGVKEGSNTLEILKSCGFSDEQIDQLAHDQAIEL